MTENPREIVSREAGGTGRARRAVKDIGSNKVVECSVAGEGASGVTKNAFDTIHHNEVSLLRGGEIIVESGAAVPALTAGNPTIVATDIEGRFVVAVAGDKMLGKVANGSSTLAAGQELSITWFDEPQEVMA